MAAHQFRPSDLPPLNAAGFSAPQAPPLQFVQSSFASQQEGGAQAPPAYGAAASSSSFAYPQPSGAYGAGASFAMPASFGRQGGFAASASFEDEPPLLEELGIDVPHILRKTRSMLRPFRLDASLCDDGDLTGPLLFALLLGSSHLLMGKVNFGVILGWSVLTMLALHWLFNLLGGPSQGIELYRCGSLLGYCLLPVVLFSACAVVLPARGVLVWALGALATLWSTATASGLLTSIVPGLEGQRLLVAYPCALAYGLFTLLTIG